MNTLFLIGAGFNYDAASYIKEIEKEIKYPLVSDLLSLFRLHELPPGKSIEDFFQEAMDNHNLEPIRQLSEMVMEADYFLSEIHKEINSPFYSFLERFPNSDFLTFNYDGFLEILLLKLNRWTPNDGFGVPVQVVSIKDNVILSKNKVVHLHGSLYLYSKDFDFNKSEKSSIPLLYEHDPIFIFDPDSVTHKFFPYECLTPGYGYAFPEERVIAPIPDKVKELKHDFIQKSYQVADDMIYTADEVIAIGYNFGETDNASFRPLLNAISEANIPLTIVAPNADEIVAKIANSMSNIETINMGFKEWIYSI